MMHDMFPCHESLQDIWMQALQGSEVVKTVASIVDVSRGKEVGEHFSTANKCRVQSASLSE